MPAKHDITFGVQAAPSTFEPKPDHVLYDEVVEDCLLAEALGYESAWMLEHHFSDYYPTPSPLLFMAHVARACPTLGLGTSVLVLPWYHPVRLAEEISMLNTLTRGTLHLGLGRGTAKSEYDAFAIDMNEARGRFRECFEIIEKGLSGEPFTYDGTYYKVPRPIELRPKPTGKKVHFYGAIGSPASGEIMADIGLTPMCLSTFPDRLLARILGVWRERMQARGRSTGGFLPVSLKMLIADTDEEARRLGRKHFPPYFDLQARHYEVDAGNWEGIPDYRDFTRMFANLKALTNPDELGPYMDMNLVGSVETVCRRIEALAGLGFNYMMVSSATPGIPRDLRREVMTRFAKDVAPRFSQAFRKEPAAAE